jgi:exopolysaccharide biosynthesis WecB/TagA/CpsF family protein
MLDFGKKNILGIGIDAVDYESAVEKIIVAAKEKRPFAVSALAVHGVMTGATDKTHRYRLNKLDMVVPDGQPVRWALNYLHGAKLSDRVYGPTLTLKVCERAAVEGLSIYLYGSQPEVLEKFSENLCEKFPKLKIAGSQPSKFRQVTEEEQIEIAETIKQSGASIVLVGLGCPRQEIFAFENREIVSMPLLAVGAAFDFHAGTLPQAPEFFQKRGLEWLYRLVQEPKRLWKRYATTNPLYVWMIMLQFFGIKDLSKQKMIPPTEQMRFG